ncbi:hypothetical protein B0H34DRAFT_795738 [Crassisporium funariophilum]|nr:hypothetical protein B0H34DRAFT_795738 [Crassisporium funariophilum]
MPETLFLRHLVVLLWMFREVYAKGGGGGKSSSSSSSNSGTKSSAPTIIFIPASAGSIARCQDAVTHQTVACPPKQTKRNVIIYAVLASVFGAIFVGILVWVIVRRFRRNRLEDSGKPSLVSEEEAGKPRYERLVHQSDSDSPHWQDTQTKVNQ